MPVNVLVVDDERSITDSTVLILEDAGYNARGAYSAEDALNAIEGFAPDVLLTDVLMPGNNGFQLALDIKALYPDCKLLLFSGQAATVELAREFAPSFSRKGYRYELLPKPLHPLKLLQKVQESLLLPV